MAFTSYSVLNYQYKALGLLNHYLLAIDDVKTLRQRAALRSSYLYTANCIDYLVCRSVSSNIADTSRSSAYNVELSPIGICLERLYQSVRNNECDVLEVLLLVYILEHTAWHLRCLCTSKSAPVDSGKREIAAEEIFAQCYLGWQLN